MSEPRVSFFRRMLRPRLTLRVMMVAVLVVGGGLAGTSRERGGRPRRSPPSSNWVARSNTTGNIAMAWRCQTLRNRLARLDGETHRPDYFSNITMVSLHQPLESLDERLFARLVSLRHLERLRDLNASLSRGNLMRFP